MSTSAIAGRFIEEYQSGAFKFGSRKKKVVAPLKKNRPIRSLAFSAIIVLASLYYFFFEMGKYTVYGFAALDNAKLLKNQQVAFYNVDTEETVVSDTNKEAEFSIKLPCGRYKVYGVGKDIAKTSQGPESSLLTLNVKCDSKVRLTVKR